MKYYSTNGAVAPVSLEDAVLKVVAADGGLYMPWQLRKLPDAFFHNIGEMSLKEIAFIVADEFFGEDIPSQKLQEIVNDTFTFELPLMQVDENVFSLELYHGPTGSYQDAGARFMARLTAALLEQKRMRGVVNVLVACKGDTGGAVANGFLDVPGFNVFVVYPKGEMCEMQEKAITSLRGNVTAVEVNGSFEECVTLVKTAFADTALNQRQRLVSGNSGNLARILPQIIFFFSAYGQYRKAGHTGEPVFCIPGSSMSNLLTALFARRMGLPVKRFMVASTKDDSMLRFLRTGENVSDHEISSYTVEVDDPGNFMRIMNLYGEDPDLLRKEITGFNYPERKMRRTLTKLHESIDYLLDVESACGYQALKDGLKEDETGIFLTNIHPAKCREYLEPVIGEVVFAPPYLDHFLEGVKLTYEIPPLYSSFKKILEECAGSVCRVPK